MTDKKGKANDVFEAASEALESDLLLLNASIDRGLELAVARTVKLGKKKDKVILILVTSGGNADVAFKISRTLQQNYSEFSIFVPGWCKSAGTLIAVGANKVIIGDFGELGPLDIQMGKRDELDDYVSGLDLGYAVKNMQATAFSLYEHFLLRIIRKSAGRVTLKTASELATAVTQPYIASFTDQIPPSTVGETVRLMTIARDYGRRLDAKYGNLKDEGLDTLVSGYSSHSFVIDREEACSLFHRVEEPDAHLQQIERVLGGTALYPMSDLGEDDTVAYLRARRQEGDDEDEDADDVEDATQDTDADSPAHQEQHPGDPPRPVGPPSAEAGTGEQGGSPEPVSAEPTEVR